MTAIDIARRWPVTIEKARARDWLRARLASPQASVTTVIFHSLVWEHISLSEREEIADIIDAAGNRASNAAPLAWLSLEPDGLTYTIRLRIYPGFTDRIIATSRAQSPSVIWLLP